MLTFGKRLLLLALTLIAGMAITGITSSLIDHLTADKAMAMRISAVFQDMLMFALPAICTAIMVTRLPADFLQIRKPAHKPALAMVLSAAAVIAAVPAINTIVEINESISFGIMDQALRQAEKAAAEATALMLGHGTVADLILGLLIVGVLAGFSEELFFRGALQRLLMTRPMNPHAAIWITAALFSLFHMQIFGFVPRMLLGAMFGYAAWWSRSLWPAVVAHIINNSLVVVVVWLESRGILPDNTEQFGAWSPLWIPVGLAITAAALTGLRRISQTSCAGK